MADHAQKNFHQSRGPFITTRSASPVRQSFDTPLHSAHELVLLLVLRFGHFAAVAVSCFYRMIQFPCPHEDTICTQNMKKHYSTTKEQFNLLRKTEYTKKTKDEVISTTGNKNITILRIFETSTYNPFTNTKV